MIKAEQTRPKQLLTASSAPAISAQQRSCKLRQLAAIPNALSSGQFCEDIVERMSRTF